MTRSIDPPRSRARRAKLGVVIKVGGAVLALLVLAALVLTLRPVVFPDAGREALRREATEVLTALGEDVSAGENNLGEFSVGAADGIDVPTTVEGNEAAIARVNAELDRHGWIPVPPEDLTGAAVTIKRMKFVGGRLAVVRFISPRGFVPPDEIEPTTSWSLAFRFHRQ